MTETISNEALRTVTLSAQNIECDGCANAIRRAVGALSGIAGVAVDVNAKTVTVHHDTAVEEVDILSSLDRAGFPASVLQAGVGEEETAAATSCSCCQG